MRRLFWHALRFYHRKLAGSRSIKGLVLDVGSGNSPHPRADVLVEKYLLDDSNRIWGRKPVLSAPVVACDAEALPFRDKTFDYVVASHLLEHVDRPDKVMNELARVGRAGYIECPNADYDKLDSPPYHRWFVTVEEGNLVFVQKDRAVFDEGLKDLTHFTLYKDPGFWAAFWRNMDRFFVRFRWQESIPYRVEYLTLPDGSDGSADNSLFDDPSWLERAGFTLSEMPDPIQNPEDRLARRGATQRLLELAWKAMALWARGPRPYPSVLDLVVCPDDRSDLKCGLPQGERREGWAEGTVGYLVCTSCSRRFPVVNGIPFLFPKGGRRDEVYGA